MKNTCGRLIMAAIALTVGAAAASAQMMTADITFPFRAGGKVMPAGSYTVRVKDTDTMVILSNFAARESVVLLPYKGGEAKKRGAEAVPVMTFRCSTGRCELTQLWTGGEAAVLAFPHRSLGKDERASTVLIQMSRAAD
jgi:hypothetical protein